MSSGVSDAAYLLDTHIWIWLMNGDDPLKHSKALSRITLGSKQNLLKISVISIWEAGLLESRGRITLPASVHEWVRSSLTAPGISLAPLSPEIALASTRLPGHIHRDPADRILIATAQSLGAILVTRDERILHYAEKHPLLKVLPA
jgi:PIN domain nuclease of toxin-antitoxin system